MTKSTVTKTWIGGLIVLVGGLLVGGLGIALMLAYGGTYTPAASGSGLEFVPRLDGFFWLTIGLMIVGFTAAVAGGVMQLVAWIGALVNTYALADKTWFVVLLAGGIAGLFTGLVGFAVMIAYLIAGPDDSGESHERVPPLPSAPPYADALVPASELPA